MVRCGATISVQMVRDPCEMVRDWCQMLRDRYEILRQWHEMVRDSTRCCKISTSLRDGVRSVRGGAALRSVRDGAFLLSPSSLPILLRCRSFFLLPLSLRRSYFLLRRRSYSCTRLASLQHVGGHAFAHAHQDTARNNTHTNNTHGTHVTHATPTFRSFCPGVPPGGLPMF